MSTIDELGEGEFLVLLLQLLYKCEKYIKIKVTSKKCPVYENSYRTGSLDYCLNICLL